MITLDIITARKRGKMSGNLKELDNKTALSERMQNVTDSLISLWKKGRPATDDEVRERIEAYFDACRFCGLRPAMESLCMALHISRETLRLWKNGQGCSKARQEMIQDARQLVLAECEQLAFQGAIHPGVYAFYLKNCGDNYKDNPNDDTPAVRPFFTRTREEIMASYDSTLLEQYGESEDNENENI